MSLKPTDEMANELLRMQEELATGNSGSKASSANARKASQRLSFLEAMMETVPVGVVLADADGQIIYGNSHVERMVRHPILHSGDVESYGEWVSFHEDGRPVQSHEYPLSRVIRDNEEHAEIDVHYQRGDGTRFWLRIIGEPVRNAEGERIGATVALIDIDEERRLREAQNILIAELNHRVKNAFSVVKSIVSQSLRKLSSQKGLRETIDQRLNAYATAHSKLVGTSWDRAAIGEVAADVLGPIGGGRIEMSGPDVEMLSRQALSFSMAFYELATNAVKYGALSVPEGRVNLSWELNQGDGGSSLEIHWIETGGPTPDEPTEKGFGSFITGRALEMETGGKVETAYTPDGYVWHLKMPQNMEEQ
ncbi:Blue-light-activated histidine kinase [Flavimaricola marinus]|uniref:histidine kinase n=2 Tax=Flavimaricola marinus TaxID=1819565 RepID=A0A238LM36_9RHOB|nr:Blue-light-activated histidine kinase [Flavimaricola marinus]